MHRFTLFAVLTAAALAAGCAGTVGYSAGVTNDGYGPDLVYAAPGVQVIADFDEPIFYSDNFYWRYDGGTWYRSSYYTGGWVYAPPPPAVLRIEQPHAFVHYRPQGWAPHHGRAPEPIVRDHRAERGFQPVQSRREPPQRRETPPPQRATPPAREHAREQPRGHHDDRDDRDHRE